MIFRRGGGYNYIHCVFCVHCFVDVIAHFFEISFCGQCSNGIGQILQQSHWNLILGPYNAAFGTGHSQICKSVYGTPLSMPSPKNQVLPGRSLVDGIFPVKDRPGYCIKNHALSMINSLKFAPPLSMTFVSCQQQGRYIFGLCYFSFFLKI